MAIILIALSVAFNLLIVLRKFQHGQILNAFVDGLLLILVAMFFSVSTEALIIGSVGSLVVSIYLIFFPFKLPTIPTRHRNTNANA
jgi:hypothetical protein